MKRFGTIGYENGFGLTLFPERLQQPYSWRKPKKVFVNSMSNLFHEGIPSDFLCEVWRVMVDTPRHTPNTPNTCLLYTSDAADE